METKICPKTGEIPCRCRMRKMTQWATAALASVAAAAAALADWLGMAPWL